MEVMRLTPEIKPPQSEAPLVRKRGYKGLQYDTEHSATHARNEWGHQDTIRIEQLRRELHNSYDMNASIYGSVGFRRVMPEDVNEAVTTNTALQKRLEKLCERLRARY